MKSAATICPHVPRWSDDGSSFGMATDLKCEHCNEYLSPRGGWVTEEDMILKKNQIDEMEAAARPLVKWLNENADPHTKVIVECDGAEVLSGSAHVKIEEFIKD